MCNVYRVHHWFDSGGRKSHLHNRLRGDGMTRGNGLTLLLAALLEAQEASESRHWWGSGWLEAGRVA